MSYIKKFLFLLFNIPLLSYTAEASKKQLINLKHETINHPRTSVPCMLRSEYHQCAHIDRDGTKHDPARLVLHSRKDGSLIQESTILYPNRTIGIFLDAFHLTLPTQTVKFPILLILHYMKTLMPESKEECCAKIALFQILENANPYLAKTLIGMEKQKDKAQELHKLFTKMLAENPANEKYSMQAKKAKYTAIDIGENLDLIYRSMGKFNFNSLEESKDATIQGKNLVTRLNRHLTPHIEAVIALEMKKESQELK